MVVGAWSLCLVVLVVPRAASWGWSAAPPVPNHAPLELYSLYSVIQRCILYSYTAYTVYSAVQSPSVTALDVCECARLK